MTVIDLPFPPSLNCLFSDGKHRRMKSKRYELWTSAARAAIYSQAVPPMRSRCDVRLHLSPPTNAEADADNYIKAPLDVLVAAKVIEGDSRKFVRSVLATWTDAPAKKPGGLRIELEAA
jgi:Holliday junction resolvase RusA-like endonuclease